MLIIELYFNFTILTILAFWNEIIDDVSSSYAAKVTFPAVKSLNQLVHT